MPIKTSAATLLWISTITTITLRSSFPQLAAIALCLLWFVSQAANCIFFRAELPSCFIWLPCLACCHLTGCNWRGNLLDVSRPTLGSLSCFPVSATPGDLSISTGPRCGRQLGPTLCSKAGSLAFFDASFHRNETFEIRCLRQACYSKAFGLIVSDKVTGHDVMHRF